MSSRREFGATCLALLPIPFLRKNQPCRKALSGLDNLDSVTVLKGQDTNYYSLGNKDFECVIVQQRDCSLMVFLDQKQIRPVVAPVVMRSRRRKENSFPPNSYAGRYVFYFKSEDTYTVIDITSVKNDEITINSFYFHKRVELADAG